MNLRQRGRFGRAMLLLCAAGVVCSPVSAGPPRIIDEDEAVRPANFAPADERDVPRQLTPRTKPHETAAKPVSPAKKSAGPVSLWGTVAGLLVVFGLFLSARIWLTRHGPIGLRGLPAEALELLGRRAIEPRVSIHIVRCGPKILILGAGPDGVRTLSEITDPVEIDLMAGACRRKDGPGTSAASFAAIFRATDTKPSGGA